MGLRILVVLGVCAAIFLLDRAFPDALASRDAQVRVVYLTMFLVVASSALLHYRLRLGEAARHAAIWIAIGAVLVIGYSFRDRLGRELVPSAPRATADGGYAVRAADDGHFYLSAEVNGTAVRFMVDTGASEIILPRSIAARAGIDLDGARFNHPFNTANGMTLCARVTLDRFTVGRSSFERVDAFVSRDGLDVPLLGMSFLSRLGGYRVENNQLILSP